VKQVAVVTGASGGMGRAITKALIRDGFFVVGLDLKVQGEKSEESKVCTLHVRPYKIR